MSKSLSGANQRQLSPLTESIQSTQNKHQQQARQLLDDYNNGDSVAVEKFRLRVPEANHPGFQPTLLQARMLVASDGLIVRRLSLEKLKKEAKDLIKQIKAKLPEAIERLHQHSNKSVNVIQLADAQRIIARENGLASWAKLKSHIELMHRALIHIDKPHEAPDADYKTLHIRCGDDIQNALKLCGFKGDFLEISNPFPQGPVPHFEPRELFIRTRTEFIKQQYGDYAPPLRINNTEAELKNVEEILHKAAENYDRIVMWYEHDSYDQLSKAYVLAHLAELNIKNTKIECIQIDSFPGVKKFIGIGQMCQMPEAILALWPQRKVVTPAMIAFGARCWRAFTNADPTDVWHLVQLPAAPLPLMQAALKRTLMDLPWIGNGLSLTEYLALDILAKEGPMRPGAIYHLLMTESDPLPYLGDIMLLGVLRPFSQSEHAAISVCEVFQDDNPMRQSMLSITALGQAILEGKENWLSIHRENDIVNRAIGGVSIRAGQKNWHWCPEKSMPVIHSS